MLASIRNTFVLLGLGLMFVGAVPFLASADTYALKWTGSQPTLHFTTAGGKFDATLQNAASEFSVTT